MFVTVGVLSILALDIRSEPRVSGAIWIPLIWILLLASRPLSRWLNPADSTLGEGVEDGSPIDRNMLSLLMVMAAVVLASRKIQWVEWCRRNVWLVVLLAYCGLSVLWSDFPAIALKRWTRAIGAIMMILVVLSEKDPVAGIATLVRRCSYVLVPVSILLIKYYRTSGVAYDGWTGAEMLVGAATDKNGLGRLCLVTGLFAIWEIITGKHNQHIHHDWMNKVVRLAILSATLWLLMMADSATSLVSTIIGSSVIIALGLPIIRRNARHLGIVVLSVVGVATALTMSFGLLEHTAGGLGRNMTFTDRTFVWQDLLAMQTPPLLGVGYDSFWLGDRLDKFVTTRKVTSAHDGYLEVYIELGFIGLALFAALLFSTFWRAKKSLLSSFDYGRLRVAILTVFLLYNVTESGYKATTFIFFVLLLVAIEVPGLGAPVPVSVAPPWSTHGHTPIVRSRRLANIRPAPVVQATASPKAALHRFRSFASRNSLRHRNQEGAIEVS
ncbi:MAG TPA: O-antigen ligase family protein [Vicinamibacterales bacterium]